MCMAFVAACSKEGEDEPTPTPTPSQPSITLNTTASDFATNGGSDVVSFKASVAWTAEVINARADGWCSVAPTSGAAGDATITITATANDTPDDRTASVILKAGTAQKTINVSQKQKDALTVTASKFEVEAAGGEVKIEVKANIDFQYTIDEKAKAWITTADSRALTTSTLVFNVAENEAMEKREGSITLSSGTFKETVTIYQAGVQPTITLTKNEFVVSSAGEVIAVEVKSNVDVEVQLPSDAPWITENATRAMSTNTYYFNIAENQEYDSREAVIKFTNKANGLSETVSVVQAQKDAILLAKSEYEFDAEGGALDLEVQTNVDFTVEISADAKSWITQAESRALVSKALHFDIAACQTADGRTGTITLSAANVKQTITIKQNYEDLWADGATPPDDEIWYTSLDNNIVEPAYPNVIDATIVSNTCRSGKGIIKFDGKVTVIGEYAFGEKTNLSGVIFPETITSIGLLAFYQCSLTTVTIPESVVELDAYAFRKCPIKEFKGKYASDDGMYLYKENYFAGLTYMFSFARGTEVSEYTIPEGIHGIENYTFEDMPSLRKVTFPASLTVELSSAFEGSYNIETIAGPNVAEDNRSLVVDNTLLFVAGKGLTSYTTPKGVTTLSTQVLAFKQELETLVISDEVTRVCKNEGQALGYIMWENPKLKTVTISAGMQYLGWDPFDGCSNIEKVYLRAPIPPTIKHNSPEDVRFDKLTVYVSSETLSLYQTSEDWAPYRNYLEGYDYGDLSEFYPDYYISTDYSRNGEVTVLQRATQGKGIDVVLMGDGYSDRQIADGTYEDVMRLAMEKFFAVEPYKSYRDLFNVYAVNAVSATEGYEHNSTIFSCFFGGGTYVGGNNDLVLSYAQKAISDERMDEALIIVMMNSTNYAGTCHMYYPSAGDYGNGVSISYFPVGADETALEQTLQHEANGHGFAKLADEYAYEYYGEVPALYAAQTKEHQANWGWWKNVDFTNDLSAIRWSYFINDSRYANEGLGAYEGGLTYWTGVWRPTENSIMRHNTGGFNAPSREAIYYRIHKLAYGADWTYNYEDFVAYDAINRDAAATRSSNYVELPKELKPLHAPVIIRKSWRDAD